MSLSTPSYVSPATGRLHRSSKSGAFRTSHLTVASRAMPQEWVLVIVIGLSHAPHSSIQSSPVISPLALSAWLPAATGTPAPDLPRGRMAVTPVRTGPWPTTRGPSPSIKVE